VRTRIEALRRECEDRVEKMQRKWERDWAIEQGEVAVVVEKDSRHPQAFDPTSESYGHGNNKTEKTNESILHPYLNTILRVPQVQLIRNHDGLEV